MGFIWKVEDLALKKDKERQGRLFRVFSVEYSISRDDKISFIDSKTGGQMSELLEIYNKFQKEQETIKRGVDGLFKENSLKAWYNKNAGSLQWSDYTFEFYGIFKNRKIYSLMHKGMYDQYEDIVDQAFHNLLNNLYQEEIQYFLSHDEYSVLSRKLLDSRVFSLLGFDYWHGSSGIGKSVNGKMVKYSIEELRYLVETCEKFEEKINNTTAKIRAEFEKNFPD